MRILVTNDDGVHAPGLAPLAQALAATGHEVVVVAPEADSSGAGAGVGPVHRRGGVTYERVDLGLDADVFAIDGLPAMAVIAVCLGGFGGRPDIVVAGINLGLNAGFSVLHSGTVGAALTATHFGLRSMAVSTEHSGDVAAVHWSSAAAIAAGAVGHLAKAPAGTVLNVNVPNRPPNEIRGIRRAVLATSGTIRSAVDHDDGYIELVLGRSREGAATEEEPAADAAQPPRDTDVAAVAAGFAALTPLRAVGVDGRAEVSDVVSAIIEGKTPCEA